MSQPDTLWLLSLFVLTALPFLGLAWVRRGQPEPLPFRFGRWLLAYASLFAILTLCLRLLGPPAVMAGLAILLGLLSSQRGMAPAQRFLHGATVHQHYPDLAKRDALRLHLPMFIGAVLCIAAGLVLATFPGLR